MEYHALNKSSKGKSHLEDSKEQATFEEESLNSDGYSIRCEEFYYVSYVSAPQHMGNGKVCRFQTDHKKTTQIE